MHNKTFLIFGTIILLLQYSCASKSERVDSSNSYSNSSYDDQADETESYFGCKYEDGTYSAIVNYYNPTTDYSESYTLDVDIQDCLVVQVYFPNGGYLDGDDITYGEVNEHGYAMVETDDGKTYEIYID
jgi:hypothetical protein